MLTRIIGWRSAALLCTALLCLCGLKTDSSNYLKSCLISESSEASACDMAALHLIPD